ncbi:hypothetical protein B0H16DRAFT_1458357 [Mycena metata]|uniref:Uncharacterized protein n=1 Tax=Mycena metata TaxID=1033252 RepID=A0AAD7J2V4_9AGAR|nr:hypothetical protein B0H16DRAFT_1458357 [Mycena metata]
MSKGRAAGPLCRCFLQPGPHQVTDWVEHTRAQKEYAAKTAQKPDAEREITERVARLALADDPQPSGTSTSAGPPTPAQIIAEAEQSMMAVFSEALKARPKQPTREAQSARVLEGLESRVQTALTTLRHADRASEDTRGLWEMVDGLKRELAIVAESLKPLKITAEREGVLERMRKLESELNEFAAALPPDQRPLYYDSAYALENPIQHLDPMGQIMILLGLVCNVILGLSIGHTNFLFSSITLLIKLAMSVHMNPDAGDDSSYDACTPQCSD